MPLRRGRWRCRGAKRLRKIKKIYIQPIPSAPALHAERKAGLPETAAPLSSLILTKSHLTCLLHKQLHQRLALVGHLVVKHGILQHLLQLANLARRLKVEHLHYLCSVNAGLQQTLVVLFLKVVELRAHNAEILEEMALAHLVLARYVGLAQHHQVVYVVAGIVKQSPYALSVTTSSAMTIGRICRFTSFCTYFILLSSGSFSRLNISGTIFAPI